MNIKVSRILPLTVLSIGIAATASITALNNQNLSFAASTKQLGPIFRARQDEAKSTIGSINRAQQAYYLEQGRFTSQFGQLGIGVPSETNFYSYKIARAEPKRTIATAAAKQTGLRSYAGVVYVLSNNTTITAICETNSASRTPPALPQLVRNNIQCPGGSTRL